MSITPQSSLEAARLGLGLPALEEAVHTADPRAILIPHRILRRVIKQHASIAGLGLRVPHRKSYVLRHDELLAIVDPLELDLAPYVTLADTVILLARPTPERVATLSADALLLKYWRMLFHARVHLALDQLVADGRLSSERVRQRIAELGEAEFSEIRGVLRNEDYLLPPRSDASIYFEFVAVYLELRYFSPDLVASYFPELRNLERVDEIVLAELDGPALLAATRLAAAPDPRHQGDAARESSERGSRRPRQRPGATPAPQASQKLLDRADQVRSAGNVVRSAILRMQSAHSGPPEARLGRAAAHADLEQLAARLQAACGFAAAEIGEWSRALSPLLEYSDRGIWTPEARLLYDLQKVCVDHERGIYALNLWPWLWSLGQEPLKRLLPGQRDVLVVKHLRSAQARLAAARVSERSRRRLDHLFETALHHAENLLRSRFQPTIDNTLDRVGLVPHNLPERVARQKLVAELLDRIVERGFLSMGDLRDALSRNSLKLPDLDAASPERWLLGDQLLQADQQLAARLDGVYRRGEIYLRLPQRLSSLAFGTRLGRFLTRYAAIPFGGAYLALEFAYHLLHMVSHLRGSDLAAEMPPEPTHQSQLGWWLTVFGLGVFFEGLLHHRAFRALSLEVFWTVGQVARRLLIDWPRHLLDLPWVRALLASPQFRLLKRYLFKPAIISCLVWATISLVFEHEATPQAGLGLFLVVNLLLNSRFGRNVDELVTDWIVQAWHRIRIHILSAVLRFILEVFRRILETIERLLYAVDEWLRFKAGESTSTTVLKAVLTPIWRVIDYVIRVFVNVLIEPQINPIKHFPVVTVSHKIILPFTGTLTSILAGPLGTVLAGAIAGPTILLIPGMFGFLVWELKENWRLYEVNRPRDLGPIIVGHHGETVIRLLRPGFRSGTLPKLFAKLRKAHRRAFWTGHWKSSGKQLAGLHGVEEHLRRFIERDLLLLVVASKGWQAGPLTVGEIRLGTNRIVFELYAPELDEPSLWIALEAQAGWLVASVHERGWLKRLSRRQRRTLANALAGFYKLAGVDLVREQLDALIAPPQTYQIDERGLVVHPRLASAEMVYALRDWPPTRPADADWALPLDAPRREELAFACAPLAWRHWLLIWDQDQLGANPAPSYAASLHILPDGISA